MTKSDGSRLAVALAVVLAGCSTSSGTQGEVEETSVLATVDGEPVTLADLDSRAGDQLAQLDHQYRSQRHQLIQSGLENTVRDRLLDAEAEARGISKAELLNTEVNSQINVTDENVDTWYQQNLARLGGRSLDELRPQIMRFLQDQRREQVLKTLTDGLAEEREVVFLLEPFRVTFDDEGSPTLGPDGAPVTLVEFSDFECPYCERFAGTLHQLEENFGDKLRIVYRQFPLNIHPNAFKAAEASLCAHAQGEFWQMHDLLFAEQSALDVPALKEKAGRLGLDQAKFDTCLDSGTYRDQIHRDLQEGSRYGVDGTPALFVNGIRLEGGAVSYDVAAALIPKAAEKREAVRARARTAFVLRRATVASELQPRAEAQNPAAATEVAEAIAEIDAPGDRVGAPRAS
jgi:predicted DsbA family dithiol-disulfide isomerase